ncbi:MAG: RagB/SusD family nutrient uptake outer membrane protein [Tannerella sp.]|nr:RagB/SusD family nutrient uptake outer membrane protein [Tannerella sp.]
MNNKLYIAMLLLPVLAACNDDFLNVPSRTALSTAIYFQTQSDFEQGINGAYAPLRNMYCNGSGAWVMGELRSDNTTYKYNPNDRGTIAAEFIKDFLEDPTSGIISHKYVINYDIISRANHLLEPIDGVDFDAKVKNNIKGQALFLRALAYLDLVQYFGSVPLHLKPVKTLEETALPLSSPEDIYRQIIEDAEQAVALLPDKATQEPGRATSGAAKMLLGHVYILQKRWAEAESVLKGINGYELLDYADVFDPNRKNHAESVFEIQYKEGNEGFASNFFYIFLVQPITAEEVSAVTGITEVARTVEGYNIPTPDIIAAYEAGDVRKDASVGTLTAHGRPYPYIKKYCHAHALTNNTNDNWPVYRYSEVLLFIAEALNEQQDKGSEALTYLNRVRNRAGLGNSEASGQEAIREAIFKERRVELAFENKRWPDLVRSDKAEEVMKAYGARVKANPQAYYFPEGITVAPAAYTDIRTLFPIPSSETSLRPQY